MMRTLVIGFGNLDRADDGAAFHIVLPAAGGEYGTGAQMSTDQVKQI